MTSWLAGLSACVALACGGGGPAASTPRIIGGTAVPASDGIARTTVALILQDGTPFCSGTLISPRHVLTAAHCLVLYANRPIYAYFGLIAKAGYLDQSRIVPMRYYRLHPGFDWAAMAVAPAVRPPNDIALVTLAANAPAGSVPAPVLGAADPVALGETLLLAGYGVSGPSPDSSGILRQVTSMLVAASPMSQEVSYGNTPGRSSCLGDSGGPAFVFRPDGLKLLGVTSRVTQSCLDQGVDTDVRYFRDWLVLNEPAGDFQ